jgi:hypothetical protein
MLAVAGLWIERHRQLRPVRFSFLRLYRQALNAFATPISCSSSEGMAGAVKEVGTLDNPQLQHSHQSGAYERRELRMRW